MQGNYIAAAVAILGWVGLFAYMVIVDRRAQDVKNDES